MVEKGNVQIMLFRGDGGQYLLSKGHGYDLRALATGQVTVVVASSVTKTLTLAGEGYPGHDDEVQLTRRYLGQMLMRCRYAESSGLSIRSGITNAVEGHFPPRVAPWYRVVMLRVLMQEGQ